MLDAGEVFGFVFWLGWVGLCDFILDGWMEFDDLEWILRGKGEEGGGGLLSWSRRSFMSSAFTSSRMEEKASMEAWCGAWGSERRTVSSVAIVVFLLLLSDWSQGEREPVQSDLFEGIGKKGGQILEVFWG